MKPCAGCKYLSQHGEICLYEIGNQHHYYETSPYSGRQYVIAKYRTLEMQRSLDGECGSERSLYQPSFWQKIKELFE